jgi:hypothetical protein
MVFEPLHAHCDSLKREFLFSNQKYSKKMILEAEIGEG